jgi:hypothetical protein
MSTQSGRALARCVFALLLALGLLPLGAARDTVQAQDGEGEPDYPIIFGHQAEVVFPAVIRFIVGVNAVPADIESIALEVSQQSGLAHRFTLDIGTALIHDLSGGVANQFLLEWPLGAEPRPALFEPLDYRWEVRVRAAPLAQAGGSVLVADAAPDPWQTAGTPPVVLRWHNPGLAAPLVRDEIMAAYALLDEHTEDTPAFEFAIYDPLTPLCLAIRDDATGEARQVVQTRDGAAEYPCTEALFVQAYARFGVTLVRRPTYGLSDLEDALIAAMVSRAYSASWQEAEVPAWFDAGLAALYRPRPGFAALELVRSASRSGQLFSLEALQDSLPATATHAGRALWGAQSYALALALADRYGLQAPFDLARAAGQHPGGFAGALQALTGGDQGALWETWQGWLFTNEAMRVAGWTPYLRETPTSTPTVTASPVPPTRTPTMTRTAGLTPTPPMPGGPQPTMVVLPVTPTVARTPTNTPLPPGSLPPASSRRPAAESDGEGGELLVLGALVGGAALILVLGSAWFVTRRRRV